MAQPCFFYCLLLLPDMPSNKENKMLEEGFMLPLMEQFYTLQGEGFHTGKAACFVRIGGCDVGCHWCDVKESWNPDIHPLSNVEKIVENASLFPAKTIVVTGGEPCMFNLSKLTEKCLSKEYQLHLETSGAYPLSGTWHWICVSPKKNMLPLPSLLTKANELKVIIHNMNDFKWAEENAKQVNSNCLLFLQPEWSKKDTLTPHIIEYIMKNPSWQLSLQTHKYINIP